LNHIKNSKLNGKGKKFIRAPCPAGKFVLFENEQKPMFTLYGEE